MKTTKQDFKLFKSECEKWINIWGLKGWNIVYKLESILSENEPDAMVITNHEDRIVEITLNEELSGENDIPLCAFHEIDELRMSKLEYLALGRIITEDEVREEIHNLIRQDENIIYKHFKNKKLIK